MSLSLIDELYKKLFDAQLEKNWGKVARIQIEINKIERTEGESPVEPDPADLRSDEGTV